MNATELSAVQYRYFLKTDTSSYCGGTYSCVTNRSGYTFENGHAHWDYAHVYLRHQTYQNVRDYIIYHETGHMLGLSDGDGSCPGSIMHSADYGCGNGYPDYPYQGDIDSVQNEAQSM